MSRIIVYSQVNMKETKLVREVAKEVRVTDDDDISCHVSFSIVCNEIAKTEGVKTGVLVIQRGIEGSNLIIGYARENNISLYTFRCEDNKIIFDRTAEESGLVKLAER